MFAWLMINSETAGPRILSRPVSRRHSRPTSIARRRRNGLKPSPIHTRATTGATMMKTTSMGLKQQRLNLPRHNKDNRLPGLAGTSHRPEGDKQVRYPTGNLHSTRVTRGGHFRPVHQWPHSMSLTNQLLPFTLIRLYLIPLCLIRPQAEAGNSVLVALLIQILATCPL